MDKPTRHFELTLCYKSDANNFTVDAIDKIMADDLVSLLSQFMIVIATLHRRILREENVETDDDIPF